MKLINACATASGRFDGLEKYWLLEVCTLTMTPGEAVKMKVEDYAESWPLRVRGFVTAEMVAQYADQAARFERLDLALSRGMQPLIEKHNPAGVYEIKKHDEKVTFGPDGGKRMNGRQKLLIFLKHDAVKGVLNQGCRIEQVFCILYPGDKNMRKFPG